MTREEAQEIINALEATYPSLIYNSRTDDVRSTMVNIWAASFAKVHGKLVKTAVFEFINEDEKAFPPTPGQIKAKIYEIISREVPIPAEEMWKRVLDGVRALDGYNGKAVYDGMPDEVKQIYTLNDFTRMKEWCYAEFSGEQRIFVGAYNRLQKKRRETALAALGHNPADRKPEPERIAYYGDE